MSEEFERRLREGLRARAAEVQPDPETWDRVQDGIRRGQRFRWALAGTATAAVAAFAILVLPGILSSPEVRFRPPVAEHPTGAVTDPPSEPAPAPPGDAVAPPVDVVLVHPDEVGLVGPESSRTLGGAGEAGPMAGVAVHPGSTAGELDLVVEAGCRLHRVVGTDGGSTVTAVDGTSDGCPGRPRFDPSGDHLAFVESDGDGAFTLRTLGWDGGPVPARNAAFPLDLGPFFDEGMDVTSVDLTDWSWAEETGDDSGRTVGRGALILTARTSDGYGRIGFLGIEGQSDGAVALTDGDRPTLDEEGDTHLLSYATDHGGSFATWTISVDSLDAVRLVRSGEGTDLPSLDLSGVLDAAAVSRQPVWLEVTEDVAVFGDGAEVWFVVWDGAAWGEITEVAPGLGPVDGGVLRPGAQPGAPPAEPTDEAPAEATEPAGDDPGAPADLPAPVSETRRALLVAAASGDLEQLRPLVSQELTYSFGDDGDPIGYWRARDAEGEDTLHMIDTLLRLPPTTIDGDGPRIWTWPFAHDRPYSSLSSAELVMLEAALGREAMASYAELDSYLHHRVGIREDGEWIYFVAGD